MKNREDKDSSIINTIFTELMQIQRHFRGKMKAIIKHPNLIFIQEYFQNITNTEEFQKQNVMRKRREKGEEPDCI
jgi:ABC-type proline/glycine betaine transport system ATPase subunit